MGSVLVLAWFGHPGNSSIYVLDKLHMCTQHFRYESPSNDPRPWPYAKCQHPIIPNLGPGRVCLIWPSLSTVANVSSAFILIILIIWPRPHLRFDRTTQKRRKLKGTRIHFLLPIKKQTPSVGLQFHAAAILMVYTVPACYGFIQAGETNKEVAQTNTDFSRGWSRLGWALASALFISSLVKGVCSTTEHPLFSTTHLKTNEQTN